jgi:hypothetical protein
MAKRKNKKADRPMFQGCVQWDGNILLEIPNHGLKTLRTDLGGLQLQRADPNKELLVLTRDHVGYNEIDTGYIVRAKVYDDGRPPYFGLKHDPDAENWGCHNYCDVIAWGYADGGLNDPTLFYSCQSTAEEEIEREKRRAEKGMKTHAERLAEMEDEAVLDFGDSQPGLSFRFRVKDGYLQNNSSWSKDIGLVPENFEENLKDTLNNFMDFHKAHPEFVEMHFYTEPTFWGEDEENPSADEE